MTNKPAAEPRCTGAALMATISPRPQSSGKTRYQATVRRRGHPPVSKTFNRRRDAERWAYQLETEMERGGYVDRREGDTTPLTKVLDRYMREVTSGKKGWQQETQRLKAIQKKAPFARKAIALVTPTELAAWRDARRKECAPNTVRNDLVALSSVYQHAMKEWRLVDVNPVRAIKWPSPGKARKRRLLEGEEGRLLAAADAREGAFIKLLVGTGMRFSEAASIDKDCLRAGYIHLGETKNGDERDVPLSESVLRVLRTCPVEIKTGRLFPWDRFQWRYRFDRICAAAGIEDLRTHDLRHEGVSRLFELGLDVFEVAAISGHKTLSQLGAYTHPKAATLKAKLDAAG